MKMRFLLLSLLSLSLLLVVGVHCQAEDACQGYSLPGPFQWGYTTIDIAVDDLIFNTYVYYPAKEQGKDTPYDNSGAPYPVITFAHGLMCPLDEYHSYFQHFATRGYFFAGPVVDYTFIQSNQTMAVFVNALRAILDYMEIQNSNSSSWLYNQVVYNMTGVTGHSLGGGVTTQDVVGPPGEPEKFDYRIKAAAPMAGGPPEGDTRDVPTSILILSGTDDFLSLPVYNKMIYDNWNTPKLWPMIIGGWHCGFMDYNIDVPDFLCKVPGRLAISRQDQEMITRCLMTPFFDLYLKGDLNAVDYVWGPIANSYQYVNMTSDSGMFFSPASQEETTYNSAVEYNTTLISTRSASSEYFLSVFSSSALSVSVTPSSVQLASEESQLVNVQIKIPTNPSTGVVTATLVARWGGDGVTSSYATFTVNY